MPASEPDVVEVVESHAKLRADEGVRWRVQLARHAVRLEAEDSSCHVLHVVSPTRHDWVAFDGSAGDSRRGQGLLEAFPGLRVGDLLALRADSGAFPDERVGPDAPFNIFSDKYCESPQNSFFSVCLQK